MSIKRLCSMLVLAAMPFAAPAQEVLKIAATPVPHAEILAFAKPLLKAQGVDLQIKVFTDYTQPNLAVEDRSVDANYFQTRPYLDSFNQGQGTHVVPVPGGGVHLEPFGAYSIKIKNIAQLRTGATVALPNDVSNGGRALALLSKQGLITLKDPGNLLATVRDIVGNPRRLVFKQLEAAQLPRVLPDVDLALINTNYALEAGLAPMRDALFIEGSDSPYVNIVAARADQADRPALRKLVAVLHTPEVRKFILDRYHGAVVPAF